MYTSFVSAKKVSKETELGIAMLKWRHRKIPRTTVQAAADAIGVSKSTWSELEHGKRAPNAETLLALEELLGFDAVELMRMAGYPSRRSIDSVDRGHRWALVEQRHPRAAALADLLPEMTDDQVDVFLNLAEATVRPKQK